MNRPLVSDNKLFAAETSLIVAGQVWLPSDGSPSAVVVESVTDGWVQYRDKTGACREKDAFSFQVRYYLPA